MSQMPDIAACGPATLQVTISHDTVSRFAALTGDYSDLHVSEAFARRSAYRQPVVHGMLPVACLAMLPSLHVEGLRAVPVGLSGRFMAPVFEGDTLILTGSPGRSSEDGDQVLIDYQVVRDPSGGVATSGTLTVTFEPEGVRGSEPAPGAASGLLRDRLVVNSRLLEQIEVGETDDIAFTATPESVRALSDLLADAAGAPAIASSLPERVYLPNLLAVLLYSTSVGVNLPGATATFLDFSATVERRVGIGSAYRLRGRVAHRSGATRILKKEMLVTAETGEEIAVRGKASALVAMPPKPMPTIAELKAEGTDFGLRGKVVVITGASRGIGETTAKLFALHGAKVVVNYHRGSEDARRVVAEILESGAEAVAIAGDVSNVDDVRRVVREARERFGAVHVLVNNAARDYRPVPFLQLSWDDVQRDVDVIVKGAFLCCQEVIPVMLAQGEGRIINISTIATETPPPDQAKYVVAKSALVGLTRSLAVEFASRNILVNLVAPNFVETDFVAHVQDGFRKKIAREIPMQRAASPAEVARAVVFLASAYSSFTTGQKVMVTGGSAPFL